MYYIKVCVCLCVCVCVCVCVAGRTITRWCQASIAWTRKDYRQNGWSDQRAGYRLKMVDHQLFLWQERTKKQWWCLCHVLTDITCRCDMVQPEGVCTKSDLKTVMPKFKTDLNEIAGHRHCRCSDPLENKHPELHHILLLPGAVYRK